MVALEAFDDAFFEMSSVPPPVGRKEFSLDLAVWNEKRDSGISPRYHSGFAEFEEGRREFLIGAKLYGLVDAVDTLKPQQFAISDTLDKHFDAYAVEIPRRGSKTTSIFVKLLGRCANRPGYQVTFSAQSGVASSRRFREWANRLDRINPPDDLGVPPWLRGQKKRPSQAIALFGDSGPWATAAPSRGFRILKGAANTRIEFDNGSSFIVLKPDAEAYRGEAADVSWLDEAQEIDPLEGEDLKAAILPLQDTKPGSSIIVSGTAGVARAGLFWDYLERGRASDEHVGIIDYAADPNTAWEDIEDEPKAMKILRGVHPGIDTLTTIDKMEKNYRSMGKPQWAREYLSIWPEAYGTNAIPLELWNAGALTRKIPRPARVAFGYDISPGGANACIVAAWRNSRGVAYIEIVEHRQGTSWLPVRAAELCKTYRGATIAYDDIGEGKASATEMQVLRPKPRLRQLTYREIASGCVQIMRDLDRGKLKHFDQAGMNDAAARAAKREVRSENGVWLWGVTASGGDITPIVAATKALKNFDQYFAGKATGSRPIMGD
jgi:hypothetical protein